VKAFEHAAALDGLIVTTIDGKSASRYEHWNGELPKWSKHLKIWGEAGTVKIETKTTPKLEDRGIQCMFVGHSKDHDGDCFEMWYPRTNSLYQSRDVIWLKRMYYDPVPDEGKAHEALNLTTEKVLELKDNNEVTLEPKKETVIDTKRGEDFNQDLSQRPTVEDRQTE
jgi:hypothetical protein